MIESILALGGLVAPPLFDFIKKKFLSGEKTAEETLGALAMSSPQHVGQYVEAQAKLLEAQTTYFNRDVVGEPSKWVIDLRAAIRPVFVISSLGARICAWVFHWDIDQNFMYLMDVCISSWFGSRLTK
jgi:hypothetical protein